LAHKTPIFIFVPSTESSRAVFLYIMKPYELDIELGIVCSSY